MWSSHELKPDGPFYTLFHPLFDVPPKSLNVRVNGARLAVKCATGWKAAPLHLLQKLDDGEQA